MKRPCPQCHALELRKINHFRDPDDRFPEGLPVGECVSCGLAYLSVTVPTDSLYFKTYYGQRHGLPSLLFEPLNHLWVFLKAQRLSRILPKGQILDFGCGRGDFLKALAKRGFKTWGLERQADAVHDLQQSGNGQIVSDMEDLPASPQGSFDGMTLWHVLEHLDDPRSILERLNRLAKPGAILFISVPNWNSIERRLFGDRWAHLDVPRHAQFFTDSTLRHMLESTGWRVRRFSYPHWAYNAYGIGQSLLNLGPYSRQFLYRVFKQGQMISWGDWRTWLAVLWHVVAFLPAFILTSVSIPILNVCRLAGTFDCIAVKEDPIRSS